MVHRLPRKFWNMARTLRALLTDVSNGGERARHTAQDDCYFAHLSIYRFALPWCRGKTVLDAGSGTGYGAAYFAQHGSRAAVGVEVDRAAVAFSRAHFQQPNLTYHVGDVQNLAKLTGNTFDVIFCSNVLEHIPDVHGFLSQAAQLLAPGGVLVVAVPPVKTTAAQEHDLRNPYHVNSWSPRRWHQVIGAYFGDIQCFRHVSRVIDRATVEADPCGREDGYAFPATDLDGMYTAPTMTALFVARSPRPEQERRQAKDHLVLQDHSRTRALSTWRILRHKVSVLWEVLRT